MAEKEIKTKAETDETAVKKSKEAKKAKKAKKTNSAGFLRSVFAERKKITWYAGKQSVRSTVAVIVTMLVVAAIIGIVDAILGAGVSLIGGIGNLFA